MKDCNQNLLTVLELVEKLLSVADKGDMDREDNGCGVVFGIIRDSAYKIRTVTEREIENHKKKGMWEN